MINASNLFLLACQIGAYVLAGYITYDHPDMPTAIGIAWGVCIGSTLLIVVFTLWGGE